MAPLTRNPWLAVDAGTVPTKLARELRDAWEDFLEETPAARAEGAGTPGVRSPIAASWRRSLDAGVDPTGRWTAPSVADTVALDDHWADHPLRGAMPVVRECLREAGEAGDQLVVVADARGVLLSVDGHRHTRGRAADDMNFAEGVLWSETAAGTNAIGTALAAGHAVQVFAAEHFNEAVQRWTCAAAPVHAPEDGSLLGVIDITGDLSTANANSLALVMATARAVEAFLLVGLHERDALVRARHGGLLHATTGAPRALVRPSGQVLMSSDDGALHGRIAVPFGGGEIALPSGGLAFAEPLDDGAVFLVTRMDRTPRPATSKLDLRLLGFTPATVIVDGRVVRLRPRQAELLSLLAAHPQGIGADALCQELYGEDGSPGSVRVEVSRLRKHLGPCVDTERYRITWPWTSDVARVQALLRDGLVGRALAAYTGPLLPTSDAPGLRALRDELEGWLRTAVLASEEIELLWQWATGPSGEDDLLAWSRVLAALEYEDPRHPRAAAHVASLRARR